MGNRVIIAVPAVNLVLWLVFLPDDDGTRTNFARQVTGEFVGSTMVLLFATSLLLATRARWLEPHFGGLDKMYRAHKRAGLSGFLLIAVHFALVPLNTAAVKPGTPAGMIAGVGIFVLVLLTVAPRIPVVRRFSLTYDRWRSSHRFIGVFFIVALAHSLLVDALVTTTVVPLAVLIAAYAIGILSYLYTLLLARFFRRTRRYVVQSVRRLNGTTVEVGLRPRKKKRMAFTAGQFLFVRFKARGALRRSHPFTISSSPKEEVLRLTIKASGDFTRQLYESLAEGTRATLVGCYGMFDYKRGGPRQIWVAGGIGVTPFLSWIRDLDHEDPLRHRVDFFYTVRHPADAVFLEEIEDVARRHPNLRAHIVYSSRGGSLTAEKIAAASGGLSGADVYMCGPSKMTATLARRFRRIGVPSASIHYEEFNFR